MEFLIQCLAHVALEQQAHVAQTSRHGSQLEKMTSEGFRNFNIIVRSERYNDLDIGGIRINATYYLLYSHRPYLETRWT